MRNSRGRTWKRPSPPPEKIARFRAKLALTHAQAGALVYSSERTWQEWEGGRHPMHPGLWELAQLKASAVEQKPAEQHADRDREDVGYDCRV